MVSIGIIQDGKTENKGLLMDIWSETAHICGL